MNWSEQIIEYIYFGGKEPQNLGYQMPHIQSPEFKRDEIYQKELLAEEINLNREYENETEKN